MTLVFVFPSERTLSLFLLPQNLEHGAINDQVEGLVDCLKLNPLAVQGQLVDEGIRLSDVRKKEWSAKFKNCVFTLTASFPPSAGH